MKGGGSAFGYWHLFRGKLRHKLCSGSDCSVLLLRMWMGAQVQLSHLGKHTQKGRLPRTAAFTEASKIACLIFFSHDLPHFPAKANPLSTERKPSWKNGCAWLWSATSKALLIIKETFILCAWRTDQTHQHFCSSGLFSGSCASFAVLTGQKAGEHLRYGYVDICLSIYVCVSVLRRFQKASVFHGHHL